MKYRNKTLTSRVTREKQWDSQSSTCDFSSRNKIKVWWINTVNNVQIQKRFTDFDLLMHVKELVVREKFERLKFANEK